MGELPWIFKLSLAPGLGPVKIKKIADTFDDVKQLSGMDVADISSSAEIDLKSAQIVADTISKKDRSAEKIFKRVQDAGWGICEYGNPNYPELLKEIYDPPPVLYYAGKLSKSDYNSVAVVGTRRATEYGIEAARSIATGLAVSGVTLVSGYAEGIDAAAQKAALDAGGRLIGVLGSALDRPYPVSSIPLMERIAENGVLLSEYPPGASTAASNFPARNRIISGLSLGVLIVEAPERSGALITAYQGLEQGRDVFALPGSIFSLKSRGTNILIKEGASLVVSAEDIVSDLIGRFRSFKINEKVEKEDTCLLSPEEEKVMKVLEDGIMHIDEIMRRVDYPAGRLSVILTKLEMSGAICALDGKKYKKA
ncbi:MAG: DNA-protecting protein DprA [Elusimicrobia bacterium]|nr:DNA-protecting protein DprA [Elusimicrobiota bacterium]